MCSWGKVSFTSFYSILILIPSIYIYLLKKLFFKNETSPKGLCTILHSVSVLILRCKGHRFSLWDMEILWSRKWQPTPAFLLGRFHG